MASHEAASNPHPQYMTQAEGDSAYSGLDHTHPISDVVGLQTALDGKQVAGSYADASHSHTIANVTGLQAALDDKAAASHNHDVAYASIAALGDKQDTLVSGSNIKTINGVSVLGSGDIPIAGGGSPATYSANLAFTDPTSVKIFDLNIAGVTAGQKLFISEDYEALGDEFEFDTLSLAGFVTSADNVRIIANSNGLISGKRPITILAAEN